MKLNELTITQNLKSMDPRDPHTAHSLKELLKQKGWHPLGIGIEAAVAEHPQKQYVLKIFNHKSKYAEFVNFVAAHESNPHLPRFSRYVRRVPNTQFLYVRMEKLQKVSLDDLLTTYLTYLLAMAQVSQQTGVVMLDGQIYDEVQDKVQTWGYELSDLEDPALAQEIYDQDQHIPPPAEWFDLLKTLAQYGHKLGIGYWDMHQGNFMLRGSTLIIADPFF